MHWTFRPLSTGVVCSRLVERGYQMLCLCSCSSWRWACQGPIHVEDNVTYMFILKCALKLVLKNILYYDARSEKHQINFVIYYFHLISVLFPNGFILTIYIISSKWRWDQLDATISDFIVNQFFLNMFGASLRPSSGGYTVFSLPMGFCPVVTVVMLERRWQAVCTVWRRLLVKQDQLDATISDFIVNQFFLNMFRASLRPSSGG